MQPTLKQRISMAKTLSQEERDMQSSVQEEIVQQKTLKFLKGVIAVVDITLIDKSVGIDSDVSQHLILQNLQTKSDQPDTFSSMVTKFGGKVVKTLSSKSITHFIWSNGHPTNLAKADDLQLQIVSPLWLIECEKANKRLSEEDYRPADLNSQIKQARLNSMTNKQRKLKDVSQSKIYETMKNPQKSNADADDLDNNQNQILGPSENYEAYLKQRNEENKFKKDFNNAVRQYGLQPTTADTGNQSKQQVKGTKNINKNNKIDIYDKFADGDITMAEFESQLRQERERKKLNKSTHSRRGANNLSTMSKNKCKKLDEFFKSRSTKPKDKKHDQESDESSSDHQSDDSTPVVDENGKMNLELMLQNLDKEWKQHEEKEEKKQQALKKEQISKSIHVDNLDQSDSSDSFDQESKNSKEVTSSKFRIKFDEKKDEIVVKQTEIKISTTEMRFGLHQENCKHQKQRTDSRKPLVRQNSGRNQIEETKIDKETLSKQKFSVDNEVQRKYAKRSKRQCAKNVSYIQAADFENTEEFVQHVCSEETL